MAAILCHMTSKILVQSKDNEINRDIKFCPSIPQCSGDIDLSNNFNLINPTFKKSVLNCTEKVELQAFDLYSYRSWQQPISMTTNVLN